MEYCGDCPYLSLTEEEQEAIKRYRRLRPNESEHRCTKYNKRIQHLNHHPLLPKVQECLDSGEV